METGLTYNQNGIRRMIRYGTIENGFRWTFVREGKNNNQTNSTQLSRDINRKVLAYRQ